MKTLELFCGTKSFSKVMALLGHKIFTIDNDYRFDPDLCCDVLELDMNVAKFDFIWASPPCQGFSVAAIGRNWDKDTKMPKTDSARLGVALLDKTIRTIAIIKPKYWCIENPMGMMRKVIDKIFVSYGIEDYHRNTVTYCQYGDSRMKPTDIWTNIPGRIGKRCNYGDKCHISAPRGSKYGTQGLKDAKERARIPPALFEEILQHINFLES